MKVALRAVSVSLLMVLLLIYVFAIVMHMFLKDKSAHEFYFGTLGLCMWTLLLRGVFMDELVEPMRILLNQNEWLMVIVFLVFVLLSSLIVMSMLIGILCELVSVVARNEKEEAHIKLIKSTLLVMLKKIDFDGSGSIDRPELQNVMDDPDALEVFASLDV